ncbi:MAG TPA: response regulator, partial [Terriglobales bacterium]|nr:response regulator [Terriglobales bacterium]
MAEETILIVDDEKLVRWSLRQKIEQWGYQVQEAENGAAALRAAQAATPDLILLDVHLPDMTGLEVLQKLKDAGQARAVIMMTGDPQLDDV